MGIDWSGGVPLGYMTLCLLGSIVAEVIAFRKVRKVNPWTTLAFLSLAMLHLHWLVWFLIGPRHTEDSRFTAPQIWQFGTPLVVFGLLFILVAFLMFRHLAKSRTAAGRAISLVRAIPCFALTLLFAKHLRMALNYLGQIGDGAI